MIGGGQRRLYSWLVAAGSGLFGNVRTGAYTHRQQPAAEDHPVGVLEAVEEPLDLRERLVGPARPQRDLGGPLPHFPDRSTLAPMKA